MICSIRYGRENVALYALVSAVLFLTLLGGCSKDSGKDESRITQLETYDEVLTRGNIDQIMGIPFIMPSGWEMEITNFRSSQGIDRKIKLPKRLKFSKTATTTFQLFVIHGEEEKFKSIGGTIAFSIEGQGKTWVRSAYLDSLIITEVGAGGPNLLFLKDFSNPRYPHFVPEYVHVIYVPDNPSIDMPVKVVLTSGGGK